MLSLRVRPLKLMALSQSSKFANQSRAQNVLSVPSARASIEEIVATDDIVTVTVTVEEIVIAIDSVITERTVAAEQSLPMQNS
jgi:hypothetical protein